MTVAGAAANSGAATAALRGRFTGGVPVRPIHLHKTLIGA